MVSPELGIPPKLSSFLPRLLHNNSQMLHHLARLYSRPQRLHHAGHADLGEQIQALSVFCEGLDAP